MTKLEYIKQYWNERDPDIKSKRNELMDEFSLRVIYANKSFDQFGPGWRSDRGRIYINYEEKWLFGFISRNFM